MKKEKYNEIVTKSVTLVAQLNRLRLPLDYLPYTHKLSGGVKESDRGYNLGGLTPSLTVDNLTSSVKEILTGLINRLDHELPINCYVALCSLCWHEGGTHPYKVNHVIKLINMGEYDNALLEWEIIGRNKVSRLYETEIFESET